MEQKQPAASQEKQPQPSRQEPQGPAIAQVQFEQLIAAKLAEANAHRLELDGMVKDLRQQLKISNDVGAHLMEEVKRLTADNEALRKAMGDKAPVPPAEPDAAAKGEGTA